MTSKEAFKEGFIKKAQEYGVKEFQAVKLLKKAVEGIDDSKLIAQLLDSQKDSIQRGWEDGATGGGVGAAAGGLLGAGAGYLTGGLFGKTPEETQKRKYQLALLGGGAGAVGGGAYGGGAGGANASVEGFSKGLSGGVNAASDVQRQVLGKIFGK